MSKIVFKGLCPKNLPLEILVTYSTDPQNCGLMKSDFRHTPPLDIYRRVNITFEEVKEP